MARPRLSLTSSSDIDAVDEDEEESEYELEDPLSSPLISPESSQYARQDPMSGEEGHRQQVSILAALVAALRKSAVMCSLGDGEDETCPFTSSMDIGWPTEVRHVAHVTFDRFSGFLGLPVEFEHDVPSRVPSASASVFGVSVLSMQCSNDGRWNSVPTILFSMQRHLYAQGGLQVEGIFRINAENSQELYVRDQLSRGIVPHGVDLHCLAGLIKAWFRELPNGVLDSLTPDQVVHCNTQEDCSQLVRMLPPTEAALLDWAINLMADIVENEHHNKMNPRSIAMVFAPNMTQMADPLTALIHAVQVMNFLKTLIIKTLQERDEAAAVSQVFQSCFESPSGKNSVDSSKSPKRSSSEKAPDFCGFEGAGFTRFLFSVEQTAESDIEEFFHGFKKSEVDEGHEPKCINGLAITGGLVAIEDRSEGILHRLSLRRGVRKLCRHPVFQLSKLTKKSGEDGREIWA